jgi:large subunit ribosomal protein L29|tara:strand:- start:11845 stop:12066 length:222 start_codon:yes stop_codon:yes gene_type:complete
MAIIKKKELKQLNKSQLVKKLEELQRELIRVNTQKSTGTNIENPGRVKEIKRTIAKLLTKLNNENLREETVNA